MPKPGIVFEPSLSQKALEVFCVRDHAREVPEELGFDAELYFSTNK